MDQNPNHTDTAGRRPPPAGEVASEVAGTAKDQAREVAYEVKDQAKTLASDVRYRVGEQARTQNEKLAGTIRRLADELDEMAQGRDESPARSVVSTIADRGRQAADYLAERGPEGALQEVQEFARRRPGAFLAVAAAAGFVVGRLGKSVLQAGSDNGTTAAAPTRIATTSTGAGVYESGYSGSAAGMAGSPIEPVPPVTPVATTPSVAAAAPPPAGAMPTAPGAMPTAPGAMPTAMDDEMSAGRAPR
jgi:ElaB/YqjD/DUF883 family membrane-anchored ribosome-binding protein